MRRIQKLAAIPLLGVALMATPAVFAQDHHDNGHYVHHSEWRKGYHMKQEDWNRGDHIDNWKQYHLHQPPRGYEWRRVDGNYVMAAAATGVIASVVAASTH